MKRLVLSILIALATSLVGCTTYRTVAGFDDGSGVMYGSVSADLTQGTARISVEEYAGTLSCEGNSKTTVVNMNLDCSGQGGVAKLHCNDGRQLTAYWDADSCTKGSGVGKDTKGNKFQFVYGMNDKEAAEKLMDMSSKKLGVSQEKLATDISVFAEKVTAEHKRNASQDMSEDFAEALAFGAVLFLSYQSMQHAYSGYGASGYSGSGFSTLALDPGTGQQKKATAIGSTESSCSSDLQCGFGAQCLKEMGSFSGVCAKSVNEFGQPTFTRPEADITLRDRGTERCHYDTDCPPMFKCDSKYKVCKTY